MATPQSYVESYVGYVDPEYLLVAGNLLQSFKEATYAKMQIEKGHKVLDVGCGAGMDTIPLAHLVGVSGEVVGVDYDEAMIAEAEERAQEASASGWVQHRFADATALPFEAGTFDSCRSERLFQHLPDAQAALAEMVRVTKRNGRVVVLDTDWGTASIDSREVDIERLFTRFFADTRHNGYSGRKLYRIFKEQGLADVSFEICPVPVTSYALFRQMLSMDKNEPKAIAAKALTEDEVRRWRQSLEEADANGLFFAYACLVLAVGRKV
jgi:ubiquinone/menaquinone biosynthesis C-methylase UbiE